MSRFPWRDTSEDIAGQSGSQWETPGGAQEKADKAEENAEKYSDDQLAQHVAVGTHLAENIIESPARRFVSDTKITVWDNKADGNLVTQTTKGMMSPEDKAKLDKSTNGMTPDTLMLRDAGGRAKVAAPSAANDIARKQEVDDVQANLNSHTGNADIHTSAAEHAKLAGIQAGAEVNQNAFSKVNDVQAGSKTDGLTMKGGTGITVTTNPITKELMITATGSATPGPHASSHITGGTDVIPDAEIDGSSGLMSGADAAFVRRDGETKTGAQAKADAAKETAMSYTDEVLGQITPASIGAETPAGALAKADEAQQAAEEYADSVGQAAKNYADQQDVLIKADYVRQPGYATTSGTSTAYTVTLNPAPASIPDGFGITIVPHVDSGASPTLSINGLTAIALKNMDGTAIQMKAGKPYSFRKVGTDFLASSGGGGVVIKSLQRGTTSIPGGSASVDIAITGVDLTKAILRFDFQGPSADTSTMYAMGEFLNSTTLRFSRGAINSILGVSIQWEVIEFDNVKSLQRGKTTNTDSSQKTVSISSVNQLKSLIFYSLMTTASSQSVAQMGARFSSSTSIILLCPSSLGTSTLYYQVIEFNG